MSSSPAPTAAHRSSTTAARLVSGVRRAAGRTVEAIARHNAVVILLLLTFLARLYLADWNSYWNDEILSVYIYGSANDTVVDAIRKLGNNSVHPPLYQFILYLWMGLFGVLETATRTLSNIYVTLAGLFLYLTVNLTWGRLVAFLSTAAFSIMALTTEYGLETRSYAQTLFLVTFSSYLLIRGLLDMKTSGRWSLRDRIPLLVLFIGANTATSLTHYYNLLWLAAQALFALAFVLIEHPRSHLVRAVLVLAAVFAAAPAIFLATWSRFFFPQFDSHASEYSVAGSPARTPVHLLYNALLEPNITGELVGSLIVSVAILALVVVAIVGLARSRRTGRADADWAIVHFAWWFVIPLVTVYAVFSALGVERYQARYFIFSLPPLAALTVIALASGVAYVRRTATPQARRNLTAAVVIVGIMVAFIPGGFSAATSRKTDWRGNAQRIVSVVESDPGNDYLLIEGAFGTGSRANYYFERYSDDVRVSLSIPTRMESAGEFADLRSLLDTEHPDRIILVLNHFNPGRFPNLLAFLDSEYERVTSQFDEQGRGGYIEFAQRSNDPIE